MSINAAPTPAVKAVVSKIFCFLGQNLTEKDSTQAIVEGRSSLFIARLGIDVLCWKNISHETHGGGGNCVMLSCIFFQKRNIVSWTRVRGGFLCKALRKMAVL